MMYRHNFIFYKETKFKEISELGIKVPKDWKVVKLKEIAEIIMGQSPPSSTYNEYGEGLPFLQGKTEFGYIYPNPVKYTTKPIKIAEKDDILISVRAPVGDVNIVPYKLCIGRGLAAIRINKSKGYYMFYFYWFQIIKSWLESLGKGSTFQAITKKDLENLEIPLPPLEEQKAIAEILSTIDKAIEKTQEAIEKTEKLKKGLMQKLLTGEIRIKEENEKWIFYKETEFQDTEIGKIPKKWRVVKLKEIADVKEGIYGRRSDNGNIIQLKADSITDDGRIDPTKYALIIVDKEISEYILKPGDILLSNRNSIDKVGKCAIFCGEIERCVYSNLLTRIRVITNNVIPEWLLYILMKMYSDGRFKTLATRAVNQVLLKKTTVENLRIFFPPIEEQKRIAEVLITVDNKIELLKKKKELLEKVKKWFMQKLLTGEIRVKIYK